MTVVFLLEEPSARDLLEGLLPRLLPPAVEWQFLVFDGKQDLERQLVRKLRGWQRPGATFVVLRDQDAADCMVVKARLAALAKESGRHPVLIRIACRELESWIVGDWGAVADAFEEPRLAGLTEKAVYRDPDQLVRPVEEIRKHIPTYGKRDGARRLGPLLDPSRNRSASFRAFCRGVQALVADTSA